MSDIIQPDRVTLNGHTLVWRDYPGYAEVTCRFCEFGAPAVATLAPTGELVRGWPDWVGSRTDSLDRLLAHCGVAVTGPAHEAAATLLALGATVRDAVAAYVEAGSPASSA